MSTKEATDPNAEWHHIDANDRVLGRMATEAATLLIGKHRPDWAANVVAPVYVVITNTDTVKLTGKKEDQKMYRRYSGYPGGLRERSVRTQRRRDSRRIVESAVSGMLPKNNLRKLVMRHLKLYPTAEHPHLAQLGGAKK
ncbi:50S ribosomal protein L13 [bacterium]|nr:50S ribosomal protein L13 [bacterium]